MDFLQRQGVEVKVIPGIPLFHTDVQLFFAPWQCFLL